jgi:NADPH-dependent 2,4-dienoyl-CoA reductase/sulfur reductase-like enzyme
VPDPRAGCRIRVEHWAVAERLGRHAARAMLDRAGAYEEVPFFWTRQFGKSIKYAGTWESFDRVAFRGDLDDGSFLAGYYAGDRLTAAAAVGHSDEFSAAMHVLNECRSVPFETFAEEDADLRGAAS